jgi:hypothetical protein
MDTNTQRSDRSVTDLIRELREETTTLFKQEVALAKTEMSEKACKFGRNAAFVALGAFVAYAGLIFVLLSVAFLLVSGFERMGLTENTSLWLGPGIVGVVIGVLGYVLVQKAIHTLSRESLAPEKTIQTLKEDKQWTQEKFSRA